MMTMAIPDVEILAVRLFTLLMCSPDGSNVYGSRGREVEVMGLVNGLESCKIVFLHNYKGHLLRHFCCRIYRLGTIHFVTDRRTDDSIMPIADHTACNSKIV